MLLHISHYRPLLARTVPLHDSARATGIDFSFAGDASVYCGPTGPSVFKKASEILALVVVGGERTQTKS